MGWPLGSIGHMKAKMVAVLFDWLFSSPFLTAATQHTGDHVQTAGTICLLVMIYYLCLSPEAYATWEGWCPSRMHDMSGVNKM